MADILVVDDQDRYLDLCRRAMPEHRYRGPARNWRETSALLDELGDRVDLVLLDVHFDIPAPDLLGFQEQLDEIQLRRLRERQGLHILEALRRSRPDLPVILMTSRDELPLEVASVRSGAEEYTYFLDDDVIDARTLQGQIASIVAARRGEEADGPVFWGRSLQMRRIRQRLAILARGRLPVVLLGPTGTGKSLLARHFVHARSGRPGRFVAVDLSTIPRELMAAHLFGSVRGAYTGAVADRMGAFEAAHQGTLFLDEVGNLSLDAQKMLLSVLQEGTVTRLGSLEERAVDVKLVVATNEDLAARVREGSFRDDLYMRLNPATALTLPPLTERQIDVGSLLRFSLESALGRPYLRGMVDDYRASQKLPAGRVEVLAGGGVPAPESGVLTLWFPDRSMRLLEAHSWPGNLREFAMVVENAVLFALAEMAAVRGERADLVQVRPKLVADLLRGQPEEVEDGWRTTVRIRPADTLNKVAVECERQYFVQLWEEAQGDFGAMAERLLGSAEHARKVQLRFNQLGLKVRELKSRTA